MTPWGKIARRQPDTTSHSDAPSSEYGTWTMPCGANFKHEQDASHHYIDCDACDVAHQERGFEVRPPRSSP